MKYLLVYELSEYDQDEGNYEYEMMWKEFDEIEDMDDCVDGLREEYEDNVTIHKACCIKEEYKYVEKTVLKRFIPVWKPPLKLDSPQRASEGSVK